MIVRAVVAPMKMSYPCHPAFISSMRHHILALSGRHVGVAVNAEGDDVAEVARVLMRSKTHRCLIVRLYG